MQNNLPVAYVFGNANIISISLIKELLSRNLFVIIVCESSTVYEEVLPQTTRNLVYEKFNGEFKETPHYIFLVQGFSSKDGFITRDNLNIFYKFVQKYACKTEVVLPYVVNEASRENVEFIARSSRELNDLSLYIAYLGEIYGENIDFDTAGYVSGVFNEISKNEKILVPSYDSELYLIDKESAINTLLKGIFSYGFNNNEIVITSKISLFAFIRLLKQYLPNLLVETDPTLKVAGTISNFDFLYVGISQEELKKSIDSIKIETKIEPKIEVLPPKHVIQEKAPVIKVKKIRNGKKKAKKIGVFLLILFWIILLPFISLFISSFTLKQGLNALSNYDFKRASLFFDLSSNLASFSKPFFGLYPDGLKTTLVVKDFSKVGNQLTDVLQLTEKIGNEAKGDVDYDINSQSNELYLQADQLYRDGSYLLADIKESSASKYFVPAISDLDKMMSYAKNTKPFIKALPELLGANQKTNYLVLFQDTSNLQATGGRIDSIGIFTFEKGRLTQENIMKASDIDSQLKGAVAPPAPLSKYLGINNWSLKDSNWDPDFAASAAKAEWFLEKETGDMPNGVIAINSNALNDIKNFKGGILEWMAKMGSYLNLKEAQLYINESSLLTSLTTLNWDGGVTIPTCSGNCLVNWTGVVEANMGGNDVNPDILRSADFTSDISSATISSKLELNINNSSKDKDYKAYIRVLAPLGSSFDKINDNITPEVTETSERTEAGTYILLPAGGVTKLVFSWKMNNTLKSNEPGKMLFYLRKQSGISIMPTNITFTYPASLTGNPIARYNTDLTRDFIKEIDY